MKRTIALAQIDPVLGDLSRNIEKHLDFAGRAAGAGASLVVFPELSLTGYSIKDLHWDLAVNIKTAAARLQPLMEKGKEISILAGFVEEGPGYGLYNAVVLFEGGRARTVHRKVYLPTYGMFEEMRHFSPGDSVRALDCTGMRLGVLVCEDLWHLSMPYLLAQDGAEAIITLTASPTRVSGGAEGLDSAAVNQENHRAYARLLSTYIVFCNRVGYEDGVNFWGGSEVVAPGGTTVAKARLFEEELLLAELDQEQVRRARRFSRHFLDERPELVMKELRRLRDEA